MEISLSVPNCQEGKRVLLGRSEVMGSYVVLSAQSVVAKRGYFCLLLRPSSLPYHPSTRDLNLLSNRKHNMCISYFGAVISCLVL